LVCASEVASAVTNGTSSILDSVSQSRVLPVPEGPTRSTLLLANDPLVVGEGGDFPVMRVDGDGQNLLGFILADDVLIEIPDDRAGRGFSG
jgi:hypothetical protein